MRPLSRTGILALDQPRPSALKALPRRQASWIAANVVCALALAWVGLWESLPELALAVALSTGPVAASPRRWWALPLVAVGVVLAALAFQTLGIAPILAAGAAAGAAAVLLLPEDTDWLDAVNGALATMAGTAIGLFCAVSLMPEAVGSIGGAAITAALVGLVGSTGLLPQAIRFDRRQLPSRRDVAKALRLAYRPPVFHAFDLYDTAAKQSPDATTRRGLAEVARWVFRLQVTLQQLDDELASIDPISIQERIDAAEAADAEDSFTRDRRKATATHLRRLLDHREAIEVERGRTDAMVEYASAFLEEARASLAVARELPGEAIPDRLPEVLGRLRNASEQGDARRRTAREMGQMQV